MVKPLWGFGVGGGLARWSRDGTIVTMSDYLDYSMSEPWRGLNVGGDGLRKEARESRRFDRTARFEWWSQPRRFGTARRLPNCLMHMCMVARMVLYDAATLACTTRCRGTLVPMEQGVLR